MEQLFNFYNEIDIYLLILCRIIAMLIVFPIIVQVKLPNIAKIGLAATLALIVYTTHLVQRPVYNPTFLGYALLAIKESLVGLIMGYSVTILFNVYHFMGELLGVQGGIGMSNLYDPTSNTQVQVIGKLYNLGFMVVFIEAGGLHWVIRTLIESFKIIPLNSAIFRTDLLGYILESVKIYFQLGFQMALPILAILFIIDCGLGILARTVPQMNMFVIGIPLKMVVLFGMLVLMVELLPQFNGMLMNEIKDALTGIIQGLRP